MTFENPEITRADLPPELESLLVSAETRFREHGEVLPGLYALPPFGSMFYMPADVFMCGEREKNALGDSMVILAAAGSRFVALTTEAWTVETPPGASKEYLAEVDRYAADGRISEHPDKVETLSIQAETPTHGYLCRASILRPDGGKPSLGEWNLLRTSNAKMLEMFEKHHGGPLKEKEFPRFQMLYHRAAMKLAAVKAKQS